MNTEAICKVGNILRKETDSRGMAFSRIAELIDEIYSTPPTAEPTAEGSCGGMERHEIICSDCGLYESECNCNKLSHH